MYASSVVRKFRAEVPFCGAFGRGRDAEGQGKKTKAASRRERKLSKETGRFECLLSGADHFFDFFDMIGFFANQFPGHFFERDFTFHELQKTVVEVEAFAFKSE